MTAFVAIPATRTAVLTSVTVNNVLVNANAVLAVSAPTPAGLDLTVTDCHECGSPVCFIMYRYPPTGRGACVDRPPAGPQSG